jgi:hypothetical protein
MFIRNGQKIDITQPHLIDGVQYGANWFEDADRRAALGIEEVPDDAETIAERAASQAAHEAATIAAKIDALWRAASAYETSYISGSAPSMLAIGVMQSLPKSLAIKAWIKSIWFDPENGYYARKALVTATSSDDHDFSFAGPMPYSVPELLAELGM